MNIAYYRSVLSDHQAAVTLHQTEKDALMLDITLSERRVEALIRAQEIMNRVGILAQSEIKSVIEHLVTLSLQFTHGSNYGFEIENRIVRKQPESDMYVLIDGQRNSIRDREVGGSVVDVVCFALRVVFWAIQIDRTRPLILLDEPFKNGGKQEALCEMIKHLSDLLGIQFLIVTYDDRIVIIADTCYRVTKQDAVSQLERIK